MPLPHARLMPRHVSSEPKSVLRSMLEMEPFLPVIIGSAVACYAYSCWSTTPVYSKRSRRRSGAHVEGPFRHVDHMEELVETPYNGIKTIDQVFEAAVRQYPDNPCLGTREQLSEDNCVLTGGRIVKKATYGKYRWQSYLEVSERVRVFGNGLILLGMRPEMRIGIYLETRAEWFIACQACFRNNFTVVTVYATLGEEGIAHALNETEVTHVITSSTLLKGRLQKCAAEIPALKHIIIVGNENYQLNESLPSRLTVTPFDAVESLGAPNSIAAQSMTRSPPSKDDLAVIMYTSGQSGEPKGVLISHSNFVAGMGGIASRVPRVGPTDVYIGYLPLAHILELDAENIIIAAGGRIGYSSPFTLTDKSLRIKPGTKGDARELRPTLMAGVPEIMERMRKAVNQQVDDSSPLKRAIFRYAFQYKLQYVEQGQQTPILDALVFRKTREVIGGQVRALLCGGAPLTKRTQAFMNVCMCCPVVQGYGLTETCGAVTLTEVDKDFSYGRTGPPLPCCEIKLEEWLEAGYAPTQTPPRGEIHIGGPNVAQGYFRNPAKTADDFYVDYDGVRWFKTGDIGQLDHDGCLRIVDRKKDLVKLSHGEYMALGNIEARLKTSVFIDNIWVYANSQQDYCIAFVVPNEAAVRSAIPDVKGVYGEALYQRQAVMNLMHKAIDNAAKNTGIQKREIPRSIYLESHPWLAEDGFVTDAFKLKRKALENHYTMLIEQIYANPVYANPVY